MTTMGAAGKDAGREFGRAFSVNQPQPDIKSHLMKARELLTKTSGEYQLADMRLATQHLIDAIDSLDDRTTRGRA